MLCLMSGDLWATSLYVCGNLILRVQENFRRKCLTWLGAPVTSGLMWRQVTD